MQLHGSGTFTQLRTGASTRLTPGSIVFWTSEVPYRWDHDGDFSLLMVRFLAALFAILLGWLSKKLGVRPSIYLALGIYTLIAIAGYFLRYEWQFWALGAAVATVQGGSQALSRSLMSRLMPKSKSAEFFSFFSVFEKFANIAGPFLFGVVSTLMGESRLSIASLVVFFAVGIFLLSRVNIERGIRVAEEDEQRMIAEAA